MTAKPGDTIIITIGGRRIKTTIDESGVQRLPMNNLYRSLIDTEALSLNKLAMGYLKNQIDFESYLEFYLNIGYSVCGFAELSNFEHLEIVNPLWEKS